MPTIRLPGVLDPATGGLRRVAVTGATLGEVLADLCAQVPTLRVHLFDERGEVRRHVICIHDGITRRRLDHPLGPDDEVAILQAVSGGDTTGPLEAGRLGEWVTMMEGAMRGERDADVPCGTCTACCTASQFIHVAPDESDALAHIPADLLFPAPGLPEGHMVMGYDERGHCPMLRDGACSIYAHRPRTCRTYDCRIFAATGVDPAGAPGDISGRAARWRFDVSESGDGVEQDALRAAATFVTANRANLPSDIAPHNATGTAVLAVRLASLFTRDEVPSISDVVKALDGRV